MLIMITGAPQGEHLGESGDDIMIYTGHSNTQ